MRRIFSREPSSFANGRAIYSVPVQPDGRCSVALAWPVRREIRELEITLPGENPPLASESVRLEWWDGESAWQGKWVPLEGELARAESGSRRFRVAGSGVNTQKIRWVFASLRKPHLQVQGLKAYTLSPMREMPIVCFLAGHPADGQAVVDVVNGAFCLDGRWGGSLDWDLTTSLSLSVCCARDRQAKSDQTVLRFRFPENSFGVAVDDVLQRGQVFVPKVGLVVSRRPIPEDRAGKRSATGKAILERVRAMPEQTRGKQAMAKTHYNPDLDKGPVMLSLACSNDKFLVERNGALAYHENFVRMIQPERGFPQVPPPLYRMEPQYGQSRLLKCTQNWGQTGVDSAAHDPHTKTPPSLQVRDKIYRKGIGHHANGEIEVRLDGDYAWFKCETGVQASPSGGGSVTFEVLVDGESRFDSGRMVASDAPKPVRVSVSGAQRLVLRLTDGGDGIGNDLGNWADARLLRRWNACGVCQ